MTTEWTIGELAWAMSSKKMRPVMLVVHNKDGEQVIPLASHVYEDMDTVYFTYDDNHGRKLDTRDITRISNRVGREHRVMIKTVTEWRCCVWVLKDVKIEQDALYLHIWDYKTLSFYSKDGESEYVF